MDHRLRPDSATDATYVRRLADGSGLPSTGDAVERRRRGIGRDVGPVRRAGAGRVARDRRNADGRRPHARRPGRDHADRPRARLGIEGSPGSSPAAPALRHPLLPRRHAEQVEAFCRALHLRPRRDPMNEDRRYLRAADPTGGAADAGRDTGRGVAASIARTADTIRRDRDELWRTGPRDVQSRRGRTTEVRFDEPVARAADPRRRRVDPDGAYRAWPSTSLAHGRRTGSRPCSTSRVVARAVAGPRRRPGARRDRPASSSNARARARRVHSRPRMDTFADDIETGPDHRGGDPGQARRDGRADHRGLRGPDAAARRRPKGAFVVMADLARHIRLPLEFDFMAVSSYGAATKTSGVVRILKDLDHDLQRPRRAGGRGHRRLGPHAQVPVEEPRRRASPHRSRSRRSCARRASSRSPLDVRYVGLRHPERVRRRLRPRLRRAVPEPAVHRHVRSPPRTAA